MNRYGTLIRFTVNTLQKNIWRNRFILTADLFSGFHKQGSTVNTCNTHHKTHENIYTLILTLLYKGKLLENIKLQFVNICKIHETRNKMNPERLDFIQFNFTDIYGPVPGCIKHLKVSFPLRSIRFPLNVRMLKKITLKKVNPHKKRKFCH